MGAFPALPLRRRPIRCRLLVVYRLDPRGLEELLPDGMQPCLAQGYAIGAACYTRLGTKHLFRRGAARHGGSDHLAYRFSVRQADGGESTWIARRETSSWLEARCGTTLLRGEYGRSAFHVKEDALAVELTVASERGEEFYLRGEASGGAPNSLFAGPQALQDFLGEDRPVRPYDLFAPEADELDWSQPVALEPLAVFEARSAFLSEGPFARGTAELDSAWRIVTRRLAFTREPEAAFRLLPQRGAPATAMPTT